MKKSITKTQSFKSSTMFATLVMLNLLCISLVSAAPPPKAAGPPPRHGREVQYLDGDWKFHTDSKDEGEKAQWQKTPPSEPQSMTVPSLRTDKNQSGASVAAWYWREVMIPASWKAQTIRLRFEAVADRATVWLNGEKLGAHTGGATPFEFNITSTVHIGEKNLIALRVEGDWARGEGIWQSVTLISHDEGYISDVFPQTSGLGNLNLQVSILNTGKNSGGATLDVKLSAIGADNKFVKKTNQELSITPNLNVTTLLTNVRAKSFIAWSPGNPALYRLQLIFRQDKDILDTTEMSIGFREIGVREGGIILNGLPVKLKVGALPPDRSILIVNNTDRKIVQDAVRTLKSSGVNMVYLDAPQPALLDIMDEEGMLVIEGARPNVTGESASEELRELVIRDRFHASIAGWNLRAGEDRLVTNIRKLDITRFLLTGSNSTDRKLWPPNSGEPISGIINSDLLPIK